VEGLGEEEGSEAGAGYEDGFLGLGHGCEGVVEGCAEMWWIWVCGADNEGGRMEQGGWSYRRTVYEQTMREGQLVDV